MKKQLLILSALAINLNILTGCDLKDYVRLTYGSVSENDLIELATFNDLNNRVIKGDNFLLATYNKGGVCSCWDNFEPVLKEYIQKEKVMIYKISNTEFSQSTQDTLRKWGLTDTNGNAPSIAIFKNGKVKKEFVDGRDMNRTNFYTKYDFFKETMDNYVISPNMFYLDIYKDNEFNFEQLDYVINNQEAVIEYKWSFCPDCEYCDPNVIWKHASSKEYRIPFYVVDIGRLTGFNPDIENPYEHFSKTNEMYVDFLLNYGLSEEGNVTFGYGRGFVPTFHYYRDGRLRNAAVYFNDTLELLPNDTYIIRESFYTERRSDYLTYLDKVKVKTLLNRIIPKEEVTANGTWINTYAAKYHDPLLKAFLDYYL